MALPDAMNVSSLKRLLVSGYVWAFAGRVLTAVAGLAVNALLARLLPPDEVGTYFLLVSLVTLLSMVGMLGLQRAVVQVVADAMARGLGGRAHRAIRLAFLLVLTASVLLGLLMPGPGVALATTLLDSTLMASMMWLAAALLVVRGLSSLYAETFRAFHDIRSAVFYNGVLVNVLFAVLLAALYLLSGASTLQQVMLVSVAVYGINCISAWIQSRGWQPKLTDVGDASAGELLRISLPLMVTALTIFVISQADLWIVGAALNEESVAIYGAAVKLVQLVAIPLMIANAVLPSIVADLYARGDFVVLEKVLRTSALVAGMPAALMLLAIMLEAESILGLVYGDFYRQGAEVLMIVSAGHLVNVLAGTGLIVLMMVGMQLYAMLISTVSGLILVGGSYLAAGEYGMEGVAAVVASVLALQAVAVLLVVRLRVGVWSHVGFGGVGVLVRHMKRSGVRGSGA